MVKPGGASTFGKFAEKHYKLVAASLGKQGCQRVYIVFDRYIEGSIKAGERCKRGASEA